MLRLDRRTFSEYPKFDFGHNAYIEQISLRKGHIQKLELTLMIRSRDCISTVICSGPSDIDQIGLAFDGYAVKIFDLNDSEGFHRDFGRYVIEFMNDDDLFPLTFSADDIKVDETRT